jgi:hypothetical protein
MLGESREHVKQKPGCMRIVAADKLDAAFHKGRNERYVASKPVKLGDDQYGPVFPAGVQRGGKLGPVRVLFAALRLCEFGDDLAEANVLGYRLALRLEA